MINLKKEGLFGPPFHVRVIRLTVRFRGLTVRVRRLTVRVRRLTVRVRRPTVRVRVGLGGSWLNLMLV
jgi:hypothetical protein